MFCSFCGNELNDGALFCPVCGTLAGESAPSDVGAIAQSGQDVLLSGPRYPLGKPTGVQTAFIPDSYSPPQPLPPSEEPLYSEPVSPPIGTAGSLPYSLSSIYDIPAANTQSDASAPADALLFSAPTPSAENGGFVPAAASPDVTGSGEEPFQATGGYSRPSSPAYPSQNPWIIPGMPPVQSAKAAKAKKGSRGKVIAILGGCVVLVAVILALLYFFLPPSVKVQFMGKGNYYLQLEIKNAPVPAAKTAVNTEKTQSITTLTEKAMKASSFTELDNTVFSTVNFKGTMQSDPQTGIFNGSYTVSIGGQPLEFKISGDGSRVGYCIPVYSDKYYYVDMNTASSDSLSSLREMTGLSEVQLSSLTTKYARRLKELILRDDLMSYNASDLCRGAACSSLSLTADSKTVCAALSALLSDMQKDDVVIAALINMTRVQQGEKAEAIPDDPSAFHLELRQSVVDELSSLKDKVASDEFAGSFSSLSMKVYFTGDDKIIGREYHITSAGESELANAACYLTEEGNKQTADFSFEIPDFLKFAGTATLSSDSIEGSLLLDWQETAGAGSVSLTSDFHFTDMTADRFLPVGTLNVRLKDKDYNVGLSLTTHQGPFDRSYDTDLKVDAAYPGGDFTLSLGFLTEVAHITSVIPDMNDSNALPYDKFRAGDFISQFAGPSVDL